MKSLRSSALLTFLVVSSVTTASLNATPIQQQKSDEKISHSVADLIEADQALLANFSAFTGMLFAAAGSSEKERCDVLDDLYNEVTDEAWTAVPRGLAKIWNKIHQQAYHLWQENQSLEQIVNELRTTIAPLPQVKTRALSGAYSKVIGEFFPKLENVQSKVNPFWSPAFKSAVKELANQKSVRDQLITDLDILGEVNKSIHSSMFSKLRISNAVLEREMKTYLKLAASHYASSRGIREFVYHNNHQPLGFFGAEVLSVHVNAVLDPMIEAGVEKIVGSSSPVPPTRGLEYIRYMRKEGKLYELNDVEESESYRLGSPVLETPTLEQYLKRLASAEFSILLDGSRTGTYVITKKFGLKPHVLQPILEKLGVMGKIEDRPNASTIPGMAAEKLFVDMASKILKTAIYFIHDGVRYYLLPKKEPLARVGIAIKDGVYYHVLGKRENKIEEAWRKLPQIAADQVEEKGLIIGENVDKKTNPYAQVAWQTGRWLLGVAGDSLSDFTVKLFFDTALRSFDNRFKTDFHTFPEGKDHVWDDDELYLGIKLGEDVGRRLLQYVAKSTYTQVVKMFRPARKLVGVTSAGGVHRFVYQAAR